MVRLPVAGAQAYAELNVLVIAAAFLVLGLVIGTRVLLRRAAPVEFDGSRRCASKRPEPEFNEYDDPETYWSWHQWVWKP
jgi:hypothetical protein